MASAETPSYVNHPLIKPETVEARLYQQLMATAVLDKGNTLVVAPTALGKTVVAALVMAERLRKHPDGKVLFLAPTKPLVLQHAESLRRLMNLPDEEIVAFTGSLSPKKRADLWQSARIIVATPQTVENDIIRGNISLEDVVLLVVDEAHRAVGNYPYVFIADQYIKSAKAPLILALTASPGGSSEKIQEVMRNLHIRHVEIRTPDDPDVKPYVQKIRTHWVRVDLPSEFKEAKHLLERAIAIRLRKLKEMNVVDSADVRAYSKKDFLGLQERLQGSVAEDPNNSDTYEAIRLVSEILKIHHALELLETQGVAATHAYLQRVFSRSSLSSAPKSLKHVALDPYVQEVYRIVRQMHLRAYEHPKLDRLKEILSKFFKENPDARAIVFTQYRDTAAKIVDALNDVEGIKPVRFVGQASREGDRGLNQKEQKAVLDAFRRGEYNVLVATSVAEEGLDIPSVDLVVFYEAIPSEIRSIQRRGRTGRFGSGEVYVLIAKGTRDEAYYWAARARERRMIETLKKLRKMFELKDASQRAITDFVQPKREESASQKKYVVFADYRERASGVIRALEEMGDVHVVLKQLPVADYVVSERVGIERKSVADFVASIIDGRLFTQAAELTSHFARPVIIVEGGNIYAVRNVHPNAIRGALSSLIADYGISVLFTKDVADTAAYIRALARREQEQGRDVRLRGEKRIMSLPEMQQFIVESLPFVGPKLAKQLLTHFGSVESVFTASERDLARVEGIGPKKAKEIRKVVSEPYKPEDV
ncbi:MAG: DEAD/DEAH box helicase [Candidatus Diapherotrites archaeon]|nr:DEAD/DEAH box helicase [Candidatus Diapherotrites archaeon]